MQPSILSVHVCLLLDSGWLRCRACALDVRLHLTNETLQQISITNQSKSR